MKSQLSLKSHKCFCSEIELSQYWKLWNNFWQTPTNFGTRWAFEGSEFPQLFFGSSKAIKSKLIKQCSKWIRLEVEWFIEVYYCCKRVLFIQSDSSSRMSELCLMMIFWGHFGGCLFDYYFFYDEWATNFLWIISNLQIIKNFFWQHVKDANFH